MRIHVATWVGTACLLLAIVRAEALSPGSALGNQVTSGVARLFPTTSRSAQAREEPAWTMSAARQALNSRGSVRHSPAVSNVAFKVSFTTLTLVPCRELSSIGFEFQEAAANPAALGQKIMLVKFWNCPEVVKLI